ncbi:putative tricarboxylic transport membrane protein [Ancylobacter aquaticus]|uniref:Putative tricarboxylic transport membrane protein n=1 Tax=Ancylobacter aquaticus TaxID=100 RepID=A0A4R1HJI7_ANCAQ|nr:tripartite tricarboxylate transporter permease [Ancylobacter aquaticus]TCK19689.1 putative tricarboxylic transport membrane protein [Ancylobacter aquaticus]
METLSLLLSGLSVAIGPSYLLATFSGVMLGLAVGVLPALGPSAAIAILLPVILNFDPLVAMAALAGTYYGAMYGGAVTSILLGIPGESAAMMTMLDGYPLARSGQAGRALGMSIFASFVGGLIALILFVAVSRQFAEFAIAFGPAEMTSLMIMSLCFTTVLGGDNKFKGFISLALGVWLGMVGIDIISGSTRYTLGMPNLLEGFEFTVVAIGVFGLGQILSALDQQSLGKLATPSYTFRSLFPRLADVLVCWKDLVVGSIIGFVVGVLPGAGATTSTIFAYAASKRMSKTPERFGKGAVEGVAAPEAANNAASYAAMIPLLTLGIPGSATTAVMMGGLLMLGLQPGPLLFTTRPDFVWPLIGTFYIGNIMLVVLTIVLTPLLAAMVFVAPRYLFPMICSVVLYGIYSINNSVFDMGVGLAFGVLGYLFDKLRYPAVPALLGLILGPILEQGIRRALISSQGDPMIFLERPISLTLLLLTLALFVLPAAKRLLWKRPSRPRTLETP